MLNSHMLDSKVPPTKTPWSIHCSVKLINWKNVQNNIKLQSTSQSHTVSTDQRLQGLPFVLSYFSTKTIFLL